MELSRRKKDSRQINMLEHVPTAKPLHTLAGHALKSRNPAITRLTRQREFVSAIPPDLRAAIDRYLAESGAGSLVEKTSRMAERYRQGRSSDAALDFSAYLVARLPATYAAVAFCLAELARRRPQFLPQSLLDAGSGPGTAAWAATAIYPDISAVTLLDNNLPFLKLASSLAAEGEHVALQQARALNDRPQPSAQ